MSIASQDAASDDAKSAATKALQNANGKSMKKVFRAAEQVIAAAREAQETDQGLPDKKLEGDDDAFQFFMLTFHATNTLRAIKDRGISGLSDKHHHGIEELLAYEMHCKHLNADAVVEEVRDAIVNFVNGHKHALRIKHHELGNGHGAGPNGHGKRGHDGPAP